MEGTFTYVTPLLLHSITAERKSHHQLFSTQTHSIGAHYGFLDITPSLSCLKVCSVLLYTFIPRILWFQNSFQCFFTFFALTSLRLCDLPFYSFLTPDFNPKHSNHHYPSASHDWYALSICHQLHISKQVRTLSIHCNTCNFPHENFLPHRLIFGLFRRHLISIISSLCCQHHSFIRLRFHTQTNRFGTTHFLFFHKDFQLPIHFRLLVCFCSSNPFNKLHHNLRDLTNRPNSTCFPTPFISHLSIHCHLVSFFHKTIPI